MLTDPSVVNSCVKCPGLLDSKGIKDAWSFKLWALKNHPDKLTGLNPEEADIRRKEYTNISACNDIIYKDKVCHSDEFNFKPVETRADDASRFNASSDQLALYKTPYMQNISFLSKPENASTQISLYRNPVNFDTNLNQLSLYKNSMNYTRTNFPTKSSLKYYQKFISPLKQHRKSRRKSCKKSKSRRRASCKKSKSRRRRKSNKCY